MTTPQRGRPAKNGVAAADLHYEQVKRTIGPNRGVLAKMAKQLGCSRDVLETFMKSKPALKRAAEQEREGVKDLLESTAWKLALGEEDPDDPSKWKVRPNDKLLWNLLKSFGQDRGYYDGPQYGQGNPNQTITINLTGKFVEEDEPEVIVEQAEEVKEIEGA